jgi:TPR repeat protein
MRWLTLFIFSVGFALTGPAFAVPQPDAEAAYARGDYATAFKLWLPLAEQGSARAQFNIARMYERGEWVAQDQAVAAEWYRRAAQQNARDAAMPMPQIDRMATAVQAVQGPPSQQISPPVQTTYTPPATPPPAAATVPAAYPMALRYRPAPVHHHHHGGFRH